MRGYLRRTFLLCAALWSAWAGSAFAQEPSQHLTSEPDGRQVLEEEILDLFSGTVMFGKYTDGRPDWKEQTSVNGELLDAADEWTVVGSWTVVGNMVCYRYWTPPGTHCFDVYEQDETYFFYLPGTDDLIAYSYKIEKRPMM